ncbi:MAG: type I-C CRISPR-associated protein Cas8c/Csd1 [Desulfonatronovibrio sp.]
MILQALNNYYERLLADPDKEISSFGFGKLGIHFCLILDKHGSIMGSPLVLREDGRPLRIEVPGPIKKTSGIASNFCWENSGYVLGVDSKDKPERTAKTHAAFKELAAKVLGGVEDEGAEALLAFLNKWNPEQIEDIPSWSEMLDKNIVFRLDGTREFIHDRPEVRKAWLRYLGADNNAQKGTCLVTGENDVPIPATHSAVKGVPGAQSSGAALISFNFDSARSFGKKQNHNAPVCEQAAFAYTTALNHLLTSGSRRKLQVGDTTIVFWTDAPAKAEDFFGLAMGGKEAEDKGVVKELEQYLEAVTQGSYPDGIGDQDSPFYVLGLSPNAARLSVRFWYVGTVGSISENIGLHYKALSIKQDFESDPRHPKPWWLLKELAPQRDSRNISPLISGQLIKSIIKNQPYPRTLLVAAIARIRADKQINYMRACIIKSYLIRNAQKEISMSLDKENTDVGYRLGRLFAIVERIQGDAVPGANATVRDRFFGAAAATPGRIFPVILKDAQHGLAKIRKDKPGWAINLDKSLQEIMDAMDPREGFPSTLPLENQGMFVLGYYQQRKQLYTRKEENKEE